MSSIPRERIFKAVVVGHFGIDVFNSMGPVLVVFLKEPLGLSAAQVGLAVGLHQFFAGATQPPFGWLVDRVGSRIIGPLSVLWAMAFVALAVMLAPEVGYLGFLALFGLAALGSGAFHPQGTMHASQAIPGREATTTSVFFLGGQLGLSLGPILAGLLLDAMGASGIGVLALVFLPVPLFMAFSMSSRRVNPRPELTPQTRRAPTSRGGALAVAILTIVFALRAWLFIGTAAFLPLLFQNKGWSASGQGLVVGCFWLGGGITGVLVGHFADRYGRRLLVCSSTLLGSLLLPFLPLGEGPLVLGLSIVIGGLLGAPHSTLMVLAQELLPLRRGLASGMSLGFLFAAGAVSSWLIGVLADRFALVTVIQSGALLGLLVALLVMLLPSPRKTTETQKTQEPLEPVSSLGGVGGPGVADGHRSEAH